MTVSSSAELQCAETESYGLLEANMDPDKIERVYTSYAGF